MRFRIGLDFGTTNSLMAFMDEGRPSIIPNDRGGRITPSVVARLPSGEILVGEPAKNRALVDPQGTILAVKRLIGKGGKIALGSLSWKPEEVAALILRKLKQDAELFLGGEIEEAVITVPAWFGDRERRAVKDAASLAELRVRRVVNEPTAAAAAHAAFRSQAAGRRGEASGEGLILVYDFGGGTFDVTLLRAKGRSTEVLSSRGDGELGGLDLDRALYDHLLVRFKAEQGFDPGDDPFLSRVLMDLAEKAKIELSSRDSAIVALPFASQGGRVIHPSIEVSRAEFETLARPFVLRSLELVKAALGDASLEAASVDSLVLSGGSSRIPLVRALLSEGLGLVPEARVNPDEIVALGAAVVAESGQGGMSGMELRDVASRSYGVEIEGGLFAPVLSKNDPIPAVKKRVFTTVEDGQESVEIHVLQGESRLSSENDSLGRFILTGIRRAGKGGPRVRVEFAVDESDTLKVRAVDMDTGAEQGVVIARAGTGASADPEALRERVATLAKELYDAKEGGRVDQGFSAEIEQLRERAAQASSAKAEGLTELALELESVLGELDARRRSETAS